MWAQEEVFGRISPRMPWLFSLPTRGHEGRSGGGCQEEVLLGWTLGKFSLASGGGTMVGLDPNSSNSRLLRWDPVGTGPLARVSFPKPPWHGSLCSETFSGSPSTDQDQTHLLVWCSRSPTLTPAPLYQVPLQSPCGPTSVERALPPPSPGCSPSEWQPLLAGFPVQLFPTSSCWLRLLRGSARPSWGSPVPQPGLPQHPAC